MKNSIILFFLMFIYTYNANSQEVEVLNSSIQEVIPVQNIASFISTNPEAARVQYMNKTVKITGVVAATGMSRFLTPYVDLTDRVGGQLMARCVLPYGGVTRGRGQLSSFTVGQTVTMSGRAQGVFVDAANSYPNIGYGILTKDSMLVE